MGAAFTRGDFTCMAFNLKKVLKAWLLSTNQPLSIKDVQAAFTRFHNQAGALPMAEAEVSVEAPAVRGDEVSSSVVNDGIAEVSTPAEGEVAAPVVSGPTEDVAEVVADIPQEKDPELYSDVPSLITATQIRESMDQISAELRATDDGLLLIEGSSGYRLVTHPRFGRWVRILRQEPPPVKLSQSAIETLAVVAYRQPVTRGEIETIRGVSAEAGINKLLERELIYITGRADSPGRPIQYGTTDQFLEFIGAKSLDEMPASDVLSSRQIDEWLKNSSSAHKPNDHDMGLDEEEQLPLDGGVAPVVATEEAPAASPVVEDAPAPAAVEEEKPVSATEPETPETN
jgi:segregation and condensation protein B